MDFCFDWQQNFIKNSTKRRRPNTGRIGLGTVWGQGKQKGEKKKITSKEKLKESILQWFVNTFYWKPLVLLVRFGVLKPWNMIFNKFSLSIILYSLLSKTSRKTETEHGGLRHSTCDNFYAYLSCYIKSHSNGRLDDDSEYLIQKSIYIYTWF